jgi:hypothetical protein
MSDAGRPAAGYAHIERDLLEQIGDHPFPEPVPVIAGYQR